MSYHSTNHLNFKKCQSVSEFNPQTRSPDWLKGRRLLQQNFFHSRYTPQMLLGHMTVTSCEQQTAVWAKTMSRDSKCWVKEESGDSQLEKTVGDLGAKVSLIAGRRWDPIRPPSPPSLRVNATDELGILLITINPEVTQMTEWIQSWALLFYFLNGSVWV